MNPTNKRIDKGESRYLIETRVVCLPDEFVPDKWLIKGIIPEGVGVIAGSAGIGKTSSLIPLYLAIAGFQSPVCDLVAEINRKIVYVTEDESQVMRILSGMRHFLKWDDDTWSSLKQNFILVSSKRLSTSQLGELAEQSLEFKTEEGDSPILVLDTASANIDLENENSNSEVSKTMAILKEFYSSKALSSQVITHLVKGAKGQGVDDLSNLSARGGSAWEGDAMWTGTLSSTEKDGKGDRILKVFKTRNEHDYREIVFSGCVQEAPAKDRFGNDIFVKYRYSIPAKSSQDWRIKETKEKKSEEVRQKIKEALRSFADDYPSQKDIRKEVGGNTDEFSYCWKLSDTNGYIKCLDLPPEIKRRGQKKYFIWEENDQVSDNPF